MSYKNVDIKTVAYFFVSDMVVLYKKNVSEKLLFFLY